MTLVMTGGANCGLVMAADSMVTNRSTRIPEAQKLYRIPGTVGGISVWGGGGPGADRPDVWLGKFIQENEGEYDSISNFAEMVEQAASDYFGEVPLYPKRTRDEYLASLGFHVCGFEDGEIVFYNIHNNQGEPQASVNLNPASDKFRLGLARNGHYHVRNGDWEAFGEYFKKFIEFGQEFAQKSRNGFEIPYPIDDLSQWAKFLGFQVLLMSGIFQLSDLTPKFDESSIGGEVNLLMMETESVIDGLQKLAVTDLGLKLERVE